MLSTHRHSHMVTDFLHIWLVCIIDGNIINRTSPPLCTTFWFHTVRSLHLRILLKTISKPIRYDLSCHYSQGWMLKCILKRRLVRRSRAEPVYVRIRYTNRNTTQLVPPFGRWLDELSQVGINMPKYTLPRPWNELFKCQSILAAGKKRSPIDRNRCKFPFLPSILPSHSRFIRWRSRFLHD